MALDKQDRHEHHHDDQHHHHHHNAGLHQASPSTQLATIKRPTLNGLLVNYKDDQIDECINSALKRKSRVRYRCMDTYSNLLAFGTSGGAIYLFRLRAITHSSCSLCSVIPCDQGSIEAIKFLPNPQADDLLIAIGTTRGSLIIFRLTQLPGEQSPFSSEIYRAENFTQSSSIRLIEFDQDLLDPMSCSNKLYICDTLNRLYVLETNNFNSAKQTALRLFYSNANLPLLVFSVNDSNINQISVHKSQLLISTDETTRFFNENTKQLITIGKKKRRRGFFGSCFFNPNYKPARVLHMQSAARGGPPSGLGSGSSQQTLYSSYGSSLNDLENVLMFVARPSFRLWQVNNKREVMFTHQFEAQLKANDPLAVFSLNNDSSADLATATDATSSRESAQDCHLLVEETFGNRQLDGVSSRGPSSDHFQRLQQIYSPTLGNLLLSHGERELFVIDPICARLIVWHQQERPIVQVSCIENEIFVWGSTDQQQRQQFHVTRLVLLAPAQFILELHRLHRHLSLMSFVQLFEEQFRRTMSLPLTQKSDEITVEGGLLRNILLSTWDSARKSLAEAEKDALPGTEKGRVSVEQFRVFKEIVEEIVGESRQLKQSMENLSDSSFLLAMTEENIERLCSEPYTSLISLEVSIANLHTNHVIHFSKDALNRHKSLANLNVSMQNLAKLKAAQSTMQLNDQLSRTARALNGTTGDQEQQQQFEGREVIVERQRPVSKRVPRAAPLREEDNEMGQAQARRYPAGADAMIVAQISAIQKSDGAMPFFSPKARDETRRNKLENQREAELMMDERQVVSDGLEARQAGQLPADALRCPHCRWPRPRSHLKPLHSSQLIQFNWLQENLMDNFEQNLEQIQAHAFKHGLWHLFMKCLVQKGELNDYLICCILLDDVRLFDGLERFFILRDCLVAKNEDDLLELLLDHLGKKLEFESSKFISSADDGSRGKAKFCYRCKNELPQPVADPNGEDCGDFSSDSELGDDPDSDGAIAFDLVNLFDWLIVKKGVEAKKAVCCLAKHRPILQNAIIPAKFYLKIISNATLAASQRTTKSMRASANFRLRSANRATAHTTAESVHYGNIHYSSSINNNNNSIN